MADDLIPSLPNEISLDCLLRLPLSSHGRLRCICRAWNQCVNSDSFSRWRKQSGYALRGACLIQTSKTACSGKAPHHLISVLEPRSEAWDCLPPLPGFAQGLPLFCQCVSLGTRLLVLGGWDPTTWAVLTSVFIFDFQDGRWRSGSPMPSARSFFGCAAVASAGRVIVAGGHDNDKNALRSADVYDMASDRWSALPGMRDARDECRAVLVGSSHVAVFSGFPTQAQGQFSRSAEFLDLSSWQWMSFDAVCPVPSKPPNTLFYARGRLFACTEGRLLRHKGPMPPQPEPASTAASWEVVDTLPVAVKVTTCATSLGDGADGILVCGWSAEGAAAHSAFLLTFSSSASSSWAWHQLHPPHEFGGLVQSACAIEI